MKLLLLGKNGQVGWELQRSLSILGDVTALDRASVDHCGDLANLAGLQQTLNDLQPNIIVNAAAYTAVDKAESEPELAYLINAEAPKLLADYAAHSSAWLVHYSTDYVFDGSGNQPRHETNAVAPLNVYGASKRAGEQFIQESGCNHLIFRTSWVYATRGNNFAKTMLRLAQERDSLSVIADQIGAPTGADLIADVTAHCLVTAQRHASVSGLYHLVASGETSWFDYARTVIGFAEASGMSLNVKRSEISPLTTDQYPTPAQRPLNSRLDCQKLQTVFSLRLPDWQNGVYRMLTELIN